MEPQSYEHGTVEGLVGCDCCLVFAAKYRFSTPAGVVRYCPDCVRAVYRTLKKLVRLHQKTREKENREGRHR